MSIQWDRKTISWPTLHFALSNKQIPRFAGSTWVCHCISLGSWFFNTGGHAEFCGQEGAGCHLSVTVWWVRWMKGLNKYWEIWQTRPWSFSFGPPWRQYFTPDYFLGKTKSIFIVTATATYIVKKSFSQVLFFFENLIDLIWWDKLMNIREPASKNERET